jgi:uncharacterized SAM-binding protein YcdF (DUF218 family)
LATWPFIGLEKISKEDNALMEIFVEIVKEYLLPGSLSFLLLGLLIGVILLFGGEKWKRRGKNWLFLLLLTYWILSLPLCARGMESLLSRGYEPLNDKAIPENVNTIVILGGGSNTFRDGEFEINILSEAGILRAMEGARLYFHMDKPLVIVSGGTNAQAGVLTPESEPLYDALVEFGVPAERIVLESASGNTYEQALNLKTMLASLGIEDFIMVTSPTHMRRAMNTFEAQGLQPIPAIAEQHGEGFLENDVAFLPSTDALRASWMAMREIFATLYYSLVGRF